MTDSKQRFDEEIMSEVESVLENLVADHKELQGAAITLVWDLPAGAANALPTGSFRSRYPGNAGTVLDLCQQISRMQSGMYSVLGQMLIVIQKRLDGEQPQQQPPHDDQQKEDTPDVLETP